MEKTNVTRVLDSKKIKYSFYDLKLQEAVNCEKVSEMLNKPANTVFKTLVTVGKSNKNYCFIVPGNKELDLKKAANAVNEKYIEMIPLKDLQKLTGYVHGGCSPIGMKKMLQTTIDISSLKLDTIVISAGKIGFQVELTLQDLQKCINLDICDISK